MAGVQQFGGAQLVNPPVIAEFRFYSVNAEQLLKAVCGSDGVRVGKIMGLNIDRVLLAQFGKLFNIVHVQFFLRCNCLILRLYVF